MSKTVKEFQLNQATGEVNVEYSDDSTNKFSVADTVTAQTDPITGGITYSAAGSKTLPTITPATDDYAGIVAAAIAVAAMGGGTVKLKPITYNIGGNTIPLISGVIYEGVRPEFTFSALNQDIGAEVGLHGTWITGDSTADIFAGNSTDKTQAQVSYVTFQDIGSQSIQRCGVIGIGMAYGKNGIKCGGRYNVGAYRSTFRDIAIMHCTEWGFWQENMYQCEFTRIFAGYNGNGQAMLAASAGPNGTGGVYFNPGNSPLKMIVTANKNAKARNLVLRNFVAQSALNNCPIDFDGMGPQTVISTISQSATPSAGSALIGVQDASKFSVEMPVYFTGGSSNGFPATTAYFVTAVDTGANTISVASKIGGTNSTSSNSNAMTVISNGYPTFEMIGYSTLYPIQPHNIKNCAAELTIPATLFMQYVQGSQVEFNLANKGQSAGNGTNSVILRESTNILMSYMGGYSKGFSIDADGSSSYMYFGMRDVNSPSGYFTNIGAGLWFSNEAANKNNIELGAAVVSLRQKTKPDIYPSAGGGLHVESIEGGQSTFASGATISLGKRSYIYTGAGAGSVTLPAINSTTGTSNVGTEIVISNPSSGALTVNSSSSQTFNGSGTTFTLAANSTAILTASNTGSALFWSAK